MDLSSNTLAKAKTASDLTVKVFADGADLDSCLKLAADPAIKGFTTNPTLMNKAGITDYRKFAHQLLEEISDRPISFEVFSDELDEMERQAREIAGWGNNVFVKIPVTNTRGTSTAPLLRTLVAEGVQVNVTGLMTLEQVQHIAAAVAGDVPSNISVFAGRVADTGTDPVQLMVRALELMAEIAPASELIWASPREILNIVQADSIGCHIITVTHDLLAKLHLLGKDHAQYSLDTVKMFREDAVKAGYTL